MIHLKSDEGSTKNVKISTTQIQSPKVADF